MFNNKKYLLFLPLILLAFLFLIPHISEAAPIPDPSDFSILLFQDDPIDTVSNTLTEILAGIGLFVMTMFILAVGTEIIVDVLKLGIGLQSKPTAREAMIKLKDLIPGSLQNLELSGQQEAQLATQIKGLQTILTPIINIEEQLHDLHTGHLGATIAAIRQKLANHQFPTEGELKSFLQTELQQGWKNLGEHLHLNQYLIDSVSAELENRLTEIQAPAPELFLQVATIFFNNQFRTIVTAWTHNQLTILRSNGTETVQQNYHLLRQELVSFGFPVAKLNHLDQWFEQFLLHSETHVDYQLDLYLTSLNNLLIGVENERHRIQSPVRKIWRRLRLAPFIGPIIGGVDRAWNAFLGRDMPGDYRNLNKPPIRLEPMTATTAARVLLEQEQKHQEENSTRIKWIRLTSVIVGIITAYLLDIDSADLLRDLLPSPDMNFLDLPIIGQGVWFRIFSLQRNITAGVVLSGLAASAGSSFWHDQLNRLRTAKTSTDAAISLLKQLKDS